jgi:hypothetical protein
MTWENASQEGAPGNVTVELTNRSGGPAQSLNDRPAELLAAKDMVGLTAFV